MYFFFLKTSQHCDGLIPTFIIESAYLYAPTGVKPRIHSPAFAELRVPPSRQFKYSGVTAEIMGVAQNTAEFAEQVIAG